MGIEKGTFCQPEGLTTEKTVIDLSKAQNDPPFAKAGNTYAYSSLREPDEQPRRVADYFLTRCCSPKTSFLSLG